jgi:hypothetical protein
MSSKWKCLLKTEAHLLHSFVATYISLWQVQHALSEQAKLALSVSGNQ